MAIPAPLEKAGGRGKLLSGLGHQSADGSLIISARSPGHLVDEAAICELGNQGPVPSTQGRPVIALSGETVCLQAPLFGGLGLVLVSDDHARSPGATRTSRREISND